MEATDWLSAENLPSGKSEGGTSVSAAGGNALAPDKPSPDVFHDPNSHFSAVALSNIVATSHL